MVGELLITCLVSLDGDRRREMRVAVQLHQPDIFVTAAGARQRTPKNVACTFVIRRARHVLEIPGVNARRWRESGVNARRWRESGVNAKTG
eukprot:scaffold8620_cov137-Skeletonema_menzelii.AAC.1